MDQNHGQYSSSVLNQSFYPSYNNFQHNIAMNSNGGAPGLPIKDSQFSHANHPENPLRANPSGRSLLDSSNGLYTPPSQVGEHYSGETQVGENKGQTRPHPQVSDHRSERRNFQVNPWDTPNTGSTRPPYAAGALAGYGQSGNETPQRASSRRSAQPVTGLQPPSPIPQAHLTRPARVSRKGAYAANKKIYSSASYAEYDSGHAERTRETIVDLVNEDEVRSLSSHEITSRSPRPGVLPTYRQRIETTF